MTSDSGRQSGCIAVGSENRSISPDGGRHHQVVPDDRPEARELLSNLKRDRDQLGAILDRASGEWGYEDFIYRFWHQSFKVYYLQGHTVAMVDALRAVSPDDRRLHPWFEEIIRAGTGRHFEREHNRRWLEVTRPILEAFWHSRFFVEMAVKYSQELDEPPNLLASGWAALLYLYELR